MVDAYLILSFLSQFGTVVPNMQPAWPGFFQPHGESTAFRFDNISRNRDGFTWEWQVQGEVFTNDSLPLDSLRQMCEGAFPVTLTGTHFTGAKFARTECVWVVWSYYDNPECLTDCDITDSFYIIWPEYVEYQYQIGYAPFDFNLNNVIDAGDLLELLSE